MKKMTELTHNMTLDDFDKKAIRKLKAELKRFDDKGRSTTIKITRDNYEITIADSPDSQPKPSD